MVLGDSAVLHGFPEKQPTLPGIEPVLNVADQVTEASVPGVPVYQLDQVPPSAFLARTRTSYAVPDVSPVMLKGMWLAPVLRSMFVLLPTAEPSLARRHSAS